MLIKGYNHNHYVFGFSWQGTVLIQLRVVCYIFYYNYIDAVDTPNFWYAGIKIMLWQIYH